jgi:hypothetical protein
MNGEGEGVQIWSVYFIYLFANRTMNPVEIVLRRGYKERGRMMEGLSLTQIHCKHIWKCHNETHAVRLMYANKKVKKIK